MRPLSPSTFTTLTTIHLPLSSVSSRTIGEEPSPRSDQFLLRIAAGPHSDLTTTQSRVWLAFPKKTASDPLSLCHRPYTTSPAPICRQSDASVSSPARSEQDRCSRPPRPICSRPGAHDATTPDPPCPASPASRSAVPRHCCPRSVVPTSPHQLHSFNHLHRAGSELLLPISSSLQSEPGRFAIVVPHTVLSCCQPAQTCGTGEGPHPHCLLVALRCCHTLTPLPYHCLMRQCGEGDLSSTSTHLCGAQLPCDN